MQQHQEGARSRVMLDLPAEAYETLAALLILHGLQYRISRDSTGQQREVINLDGLLVRSELTLLPRLS